MDEALRLAPPAIGTHHPDGPDAAIVEIGGNDVEQLATYLFGPGARLKDIRDSQRWSGVGPPEGTVRGRRPGLGAALGASGCRRGQRKFTSLHRK
ncbi:hypothetical protein [Streptomyces alfalfae]